MNLTNERLWVQTAINQVAIQQALEVIQQTGLALPCRVTAISGSIVTVAFEVSSQWALPPVTLPKAEGPWIRSPTQIGDLGMTVPADVYLGGISGLGDGVATMATPGNLTALVWVPVASTSFPAVNINAAYVCGPQGAVIQDQAGNCILTVSNDGTITLSAKTQIALDAPTIALNGTVVQNAGTGYTGSVTLVGPLHVTNDVTAETVSLTQHVHSGVQTGGGNTGAPVPGT